MKASVETLEGNKVKVSVEVDETEFEPALDAAFKRIAREVRIPGFRPGKAPRRLLEKRLGTGVAREEALREALPDYYAKAVREHDVDVIAAPEIDITGGQQDGPVVFDAVVEVRPVITVGGYDSLRITLDRLEPTGEEIDALVDRLRQQHAELVVVDRPAHDGDHVTIDISGTQSDEPLPGLTADDYLYEVGLGAVVAELDEELRGAKVGDILSFSADHPDPDEERVDFRILLKEVKEQVLPEVDDPWVAEASEFSTVAELRADITHRLTTVKQAQAQMARSERTAEALAALVTDDVPEALVNDEMQRRLQDLAMRLHAQGVDLDQYFGASGQSQEEIVAGLREAADQAVRVDLALRAVATAESIEVTDDDLEAEYVQVADRVGESVDAVRERFERAEQEPLVRSDLARRKALEWLLEQVELVDEAGEPIDRAALELPTDDDPGDDRSDRTDAPERTPEQRGPE